MKESTATITTATTATAIVEATATTITETIIMLIIVEAISVLEIIAATAMIWIVEALETRLVVRAAIVVRSELPLAIITTIARPAATATSRVRSGTRS